MSRALILALCLCLAGAAAVRAAAVEDADPFCPGAGMPGGYFMIGSEVDLPEDVSDFLAGKVAETVMDLVANGTSWVSCDPGDMSYSEQACSQVVAGTNYQMRINVTCPSANGTDNTLGLEAHVYWPLPGSNEEPEAHVEVLFEPTAEDAEEPASAGDAFDALADDIDSTVDSAVDQATPTAGSISGQASAAVDSALGAMDSTMDAAGDAAGSAYDAAMGGMDAAVDSAGSAIDSVEGTVSSAAQAGVDAAKNALDNIFG